MNPIKAWRAGQSGGNEALWRTLANLHISGSASVMAVGYKEAAERRRLDWLIRKWALVRSTN
jgi:hypothetical protein